MVDQPLDGDRVRARLCDHSDADRDARRSVADRADERVAQTDGGGIETATLCRDGRSFSLDMRTIIVRESGRSSSLYLEEALDAPLLRGMTIENARCLSHISVAPAAVALTERAGH